MTTYDNYFTELVQVEPFRFLSKPFKFDDLNYVFMEAYDRFIKIIKEKNCLYKFKNNGIIYSVHLSDVVYFSSYKRKIIIMQKDTQCLEFYNKLDDVEIEINSLSDKFVRINKSYLFNLDYIDSIKKNSIIVQGVEYKISPKYRDNIIVILRNNL